MSPLEDAIDRLYLAFADVPPPHHIDGCPCCIEAKHIPLLLTTPLRLIPAIDLASYASSAFLTVGNVSDYLYFLPRILEISVLDDSWWPDIEVTARAIHSTGLQSWPTVRTEALVFLLSAVIDDAVTSCRFARIDGWLCAIARMNLDVRPFLVQIEKSPAAVLEYFEDNAQCLPKNKLCNAFWELPNEGHDVIVQWFHSDAIRRVPFEAYGYVR